MMNFKKYLTILFLMNFEVLAFQDLSGLRVVTENYPPYNYVENGELKGKGVKIVKALLEDLKLNTSIEVMSWSVAYNLALKRPETLLFSISRTKDREELFHWIGPIATAAPYFFANSTLANIKESELNKYTACAVKGDYKAKYLKDNGFKIVYVKSFKQCVKLLGRSRVDLVLSSTNSFNEEVNKLKGRSIFFKKLFAVKELNKGIYLAFGKQTHIKLIKKFRASFLRLKTSKKIAID